MMSISFIITFHILLFCAFFELKYNKSSIYKRSKGIVYSFIIITLICLAGFRNIGVDNDSRMYYNLFIKLSDKSYIDIIFHDVDRIKEIGYLLLNRIFFNIGFTPFLIFCAFISLSIKGYIYYRFTLFPFISILFYFVLFYYLREFTQIRDALATSFILLCILMYIKKKYFYSGLFFLIGLSFHLVTLICLFIILLWELYKIRRLFCYVLLVLIVFLKFFIPQINYLNNPLFPYQLTKYVGGNFHSGYFLPLLSLSILGIFYFKKINLRNNFLYFISLFTFVLYIYSLNHMILIRIPNILFFGNIILIGTNRYASDKIRFIGIIILILYWLKSFI